MKPIELFHQDGKSSGVWYCSKCRRVHPCKASASHCCAPRYCDLCGKELEKGWCSPCRPCFDALEKKRELGRVEKAEKLTMDQYDGPVYDGDEYHSNVGEYIDNQLCLGEPIAGHVWPCREVQFVKINLRSAMEFQETPEEWDGEVAGLKELEEAVKKFEEANKDQISWFPRYDQVIIIPESERKTNGEE